LTDIGEQVVHLVGGVVDTGIDGRRRGLDRIRDLVPVIAELAELLAGAGQVALARVVDRLPEVVGRNLRPWTGARGGSSSRGRGWSRSWSGGSRGGWSRRGSDRPKLALPDFSILVAKLDRAARRRALPDGWLPEVLWHDLPMTTNLPIRHRCHFR
jgi:hypothetical protein